MPSMALLSHSLYEEPDEIRTLQPFLSYTVPYGRQYQSATKASYRLDKVSLLGVVLLYRVNPPIK